MPSDPGPSAPLEVSTVHMSDYVRPADVDDDPVRRQRLAEEGDVDDEGRSVQFLRRPEQRAPEAVGDHDVVAHLDGVHAFSCQSRS